MISAKISLIVFCFLSFCSISFATSQGTNLTNTSYPQSISDEKPDTAKSNVFGGMLLPQVRKGTNFNTQSESICGGTERGQSYFITTQNVINEFKWVIENPLNKSECIFRISQDVEQSHDTSYQVLIPQDEEHNIISNTGWFECGKIKGVEKVYFKFPDEIDCDQCILEWIWKAPNFEMRQCSDISVLSSKDEKCRDMCKNGGICHKGSCVCPKGYSGTFCESGSFSQIIKNVPWIAFYLLLSVIFVIGVVGLIFWCQRKNKDKNGNVSLKDDQKYQEFDRESVKENKQNEVQLAVKV